MPERRGDLYAEATDLLLDWWEREKVVRNAEGQIVVSQPSLSELLRAGTEHVQQMLTALAFEAHQSQLELVGTADVSEERLIGKLMHICRNDNVNPVLLVKHLSDRAGLLVPRGVGVYSFPHRTFQEYLAACYLADEENYPGTIVHLASEEPNRWREVVLLVGGIGKPVMRWSLVNELCPSPLYIEKCMSADAWGALLAGQVLRESLSIDDLSSGNQACVERLRQWLAAIATEQAPKGEPFPAVERTLAGNILSVLGDPRPGVGVREDGLPDIVWCEVPKGKFLMGDKMWSDAPEHTVMLSAYAISRYPVTNAQYQAFVKDGGAENQTYGREFDLANHPVVGVSWHDAIAFCEWLTRRLRESGELSEGQVIRLPTEAEWEKAVRGTDGRIYPWGNEEMIPELGNYAETGLGVTSTVGCFPGGASPYGCEEMAGNVWEWCQDWCDDDYYKESPEENPTGPEPGSHRVDRGGYWGNIAQDCRSAFRNGGGPAYRRDRVGFRVLRTMP